jgi:hypothetical protein
MIKSRRLGDQRFNAQQRLLELLEEINKTYQKHILARFLITIGDEFQGLLKYADAIPDIIWEIEARFDFTTIRIGIGFGSLNTPLKTDAIGMDGPVWYKARSAIETAKKEKKHGGVFSGFDDNDVVLNGLSRLLHYHRSKLTSKQHEIIGYLRQGMEQESIGERLGITQQAVSKIASQAGWRTYNEGEEAWRTGLQKYNKYMDWI